MRILVTGGAGFIGSNFLTMLVSKELEISASHIYVLDLLTYASDLTSLKPYIDDKSIEFIQGDITNEVIVREIVNECDVIVNFAAESHVDNSIQGPNKFVNTNVLGTQVLLNESKNVKNLRFLHVSTDEVYGSIPSGLFDENAKLFPSSPYSASKAASDLLCIAMHKTHAMDILISRCSNNYGPRQHREKLIPKLIYNMLNDAPLEIYGTGNNIREWINVRDHCSALSLMLNKGKSGEIYNIGSGDELTNLELVAILQQLIPSRKSEITFVNDRLGHDFRYALESNKIKNLGFRCQTEIMSGLSSTIDWYIETLSKSSL